MSEYDGPAVLHMPHDDGVDTHTVRVALRIGPHKDEWHGTVYPTGPVGLTYEPVELHLPNRPPVSALLMEGGGLEIYGSGPPPWVE
ncbi:hypothetical protein LG634_24700 [Streptomyces bambusae]|uniref:hypothetical protein n=1 Tax=Streptomyces bambusae TaxID=1550616 RepID=UPI001CFCAF2E|nr:hypothetical protein [Streptomyces bambusae]MCB5168014.1 hypothetical protein [Streptomyces bambusae]